MSQAGEIDVVGNNPDIPTTFIADVGSAVPIANTLEILGTSVAAGIIPVETTASGNTLTVEVQTSQAIAATDATKIGLAAFNSASFSVDANGFVSLIGGGEAIDSIAVQTGTSPVVPTAGGLVTINGAVVAAGTNPVRSDGTGANTLAIEVQISQALAAADATKIGLSNFDSAAFDVSATGFVQLNGGGIAATSFDVQANTAPGTDPVVPTAAGVVTVNGAAVANHSVVLETRSRAANAYNLEVQYATSAAATDATKSGVAHFNSTQFSVDASGFVALAGGGLAIDSIHPNSGTDPVVPDGAGLVNILGSGSITTVGSLNTLTVQLTGLTNHSVQVGAGTATLTQLAVGSNGQVLIGATAADPAFATLTSSDGSVSFTTGANSLSLQVTGGTTVGKTITGNSGGALSPTAGNWNIFGASTAAGTSPVTTSGAVSTLTVNVQTSQALAAADATKIGLSNFSSAGFGVAATGFVTLATSVAQLFTANTGTATPSANNLNVLGGGGIQTAGSGATLTIAVSGGGFTWTDVTSATQSIAVQNGYGTDRSGGVTYTLPATANFGDTFIIMGKLGLTTITPNANQQILMSSASGTVGATGTAVGTNVGDCITLVCTTSGASTIWRAQNWVGNWTLN